MIQATKGILFERKSTIAWVSFTCPGCKSRDRDFCANSFFERGSQEAQRESEELTQRRKRGHMQAGMVSREQCESMSTVRSSTEK